MGVSNCSNHKNHDLYNYRQVRRRLIMARLLETIGLITFQATPVANIKNSATCPVSRVWLPRQALVGGEQVSFDQVGAQVGRRTGWLRTGRRQYVGYLRFLQRSVLSRRQAPGAIRGMSV